MDFKEPYEIITGDQFSKNLSLLFGESSGIFQGQLENFAHLTIKAHPQNSHILDLMNSHPNN